MATIWKMEVFLAQYAMPDAEDGAGRRDGRLGNPRRDPLTRLNSRRNAAAEGERSLSHLTLVYRDTGTSHRSPHHLADRRGGGRFVC
jgi:hypothetical protein